MIAGLEKIYALVADLIHKAMLLCEAPGPATGQEVLDWFGFAGALEGITHDRLDEISYPDCRIPPVGLNPIPQVFSGFGMKDSEPLNVRGHREVLSLI